MLRLPNVKTSGRFIHGISQSPLAALGFAPGERVVAISLSWVPSWAWGTQGGAARRRKRTDLSFTENTRFRKRGGRVAVPLSDVRPGRPFPQRARAALCVGLLQMT